MPKRTEKKARRSELAYARDLVDQGRETEAREIFLRHGISYVPGRYCDETTYLVEAN